MADARQEAMHAALLLLCAAGAAHAAASDVVLVRVGDGSAPLGTDATAVFVERHAPDGTLLATYALPTTQTGANPPFTFGGGATEGALAVSSDGQYVSLAGYDADVGTAGVSTSNAGFVNRLVARIAADGSIDTTTFLSSAFNGSSVRSAVSVDGSSFWVGGASTTGSTGGVWRVVFSSGGPATQINNSPTNPRVLAIADGQLFDDTGGGGANSVFAIGSGLPQTAGQLSTPLTGVATGSAYGFVFFDRTPDVAGIDTLYLADGRTTANGGGIERWTFDGATWTLAARFVNNVAAGVRGLTGEVVGAQVVLYATTLDTPPRLVRMPDDGTAAPKGTIIATAPANTEYRGVALAWVAPHTDVIFTDGF